MTRIKAGARDAKLKSNGQPDRLVSMSEAMRYLSDNGYPCKSRHTFYRTIDEFNIPYVNTNPSGKNQMRRFTLSALDIFLRSQGLKK